MANGDLIKLGTFYLNGVKQARPTRPWYATPTGAPGAGNIPSFAAGNSIEIRNTDASDANVIQWREVTDGIKKILIADRVLLASVSHDDLNAQSFILGKTITIDGQTYKVRSLTGGTGYRSGTDAYSGGSPTNNEWDRIIVNEGGFSGLPTPNTTDLDASQTAVDINGTHNQFWNWYYMYSWKQETYAANVANRVFRGFDSARFFSYNIATNRSAYIGWRPVLEVLYTPPNLSPNINGVYKTYADGFVKIDGVWRQIDEIHTNINGVWRKS